MKSYDYDACIYVDAVYCNECLPEGITTNSDDVMPVFAYSEWDSYPVCDKCGYSHDYVSLTSRGMAEQQLTEALIACELNEYDGLRVSDLSEVPDDYEGEVLHVNDHGNATLYGCDNGQLTEIASRV